MSYIKETDRYTNVIEVREYHNGKYGAPGMARQDKKKPTPEQMERVNQYNRERICRKKMRRWFRKKDLFITLTYAVDARPPDMKTAKEHFKAFIKKVRKFYHKAGYELRWIRNIEVGTKNAWHIHIVMNRIQDADLIIAEAWSYGEVDIRLCYKKGEFRELAHYMVKTPKTEPRIRESSYSTSRNLPLPPPERDVIERWETWDKVRIPKGFYVDWDSYHEGENPKTGQPYREYTLFRIQEKEEKEISRRRQRWKKTKRKRPPNKVRRC